MTLKKNNDMSVYICICICMCKCVCFCVCLYVFKCLYMCVYIALPTKGSEIKDPRVTPDTLSAQILISKNYFPLKGTKDSWRNG